MDQEHEAGKGAGKLWDPAGSLREGPRIGTPWSRKIPASRKTPWFRSPDGMHSPWHFNTALWFSALPDLPERPHLGALAKERDALLSNRSFAHIVLNRLEPLQCTAEILHGKVACWEVL